MIIVRVGLRRYIALRPTPTRVSTTDTAMAVANVPSIHAKLMTDDEEEGRSEEEDHTYPFDANEQCPT